MRFALAIVVTCSACKGLLGIDEGSVVDAGTSDAVEDAMLNDASDSAPIDAPPPCYGLDPFIVCPGFAGSDQPLPATINTSGSACDFVDTSNGRNWCVFIRDNLSIAGGFTASGSRPLVLLARQSLTVGLAGMVDASSRTPGQTGPAANDSTCVSGNGTAGISTGSGGAGGSFGTRGGNGGRGSTLVIDGGVARDPVLDDLLRGGCNGGKGAPGVTNVGGDGGGAIYLLAGSQLLIEGTVNASGAGGSGGVMPGTGGGGGGSGGLIVMSAPTVTISVNAQVFANGGGGGSGAGTNNNGAPGEESSSPGLGGDGDTTGTGGGGGDGAAGMGSGETGGNDQAGGGGGGGGVGRIRVLSPTQSIATGVVSPPPS